MSILENARIKAVMERMNAKFETENSRNLESKTDHDHELRDHDIKEKVSLNNKEIPHDPMISLSHDHEIDIIEVVNSDRYFLKAQNWGIYPQALTNAVKGQIDAKGYNRREALHFIRQVIIYTDSYKGARNKAAFFFSVLRNGFREVG